MCLSGGHTAQCGGGGMGVNQKNIVAAGHGCATQIIILLVYAVQPNQLVVIWLVRPIRCLHIDNMCEPLESWGAIVPRCCPLPRRQHLCGQEKVKGSEIPVR